MFSETAEHYDLLYSTIKDYGHEVPAIAATLRRLNPAARTVLDVACGTGEHARRLTAEGLLVDGIDLDPVFIRIARDKHPAGLFVVADMTDVHLGRTYDAVVCLFSSIGYLRTLDRVEAALRCFREHLADGGVILVEPWFPPGYMTDGFVGRNDAANEVVRITRHARTEIDGRISRLHFDYEITDARGVRRAREVHELGLFTVEEQLAAFARAGLRARFETGGFCERGLFVATSASGDAPGEQRSSKPA
jgi:SAM-dependent methyltransferase